MKSVEILQNYDITEFTTFRVKTKAKYVVEIHSEEDLLGLFEIDFFKSINKIFLGGGSNVLFTKDFDGLVVLNKLKGIKELESDENKIYFKVSSGENWDSFVNSVTEKGYWGVENLALIPGTVGASPIQNIGAYGSEVKDTISSVEFFDLETKEKRVFSKSDCKFDYRDSIFKNELKDKVFITSVIFELNKNGEPNLSYAPLVDYIEKHKIQIKNSKNIADIVSRIRLEKLPNPKEIGNAGSFFKNVYVSKEKLDNLKNIYPEIPSFEDGEEIKIPTGWLIEKAGLKGFRDGNVGVYEKQALVLVNFGGATGLEVKNLADKIKKEIKNKFDIEINYEVNLI